MSIQIIKRDKWLRKACVLALLLPGSAFAVPVFDNWSADDTGTITPDTGAGSYCGSTGVTCTILVSGNGFLQQEIQDTNDGATYIQTIITDANAGSSGGTPAAQLPYSDESFIRRGQATSGIMSQQRTSENSGSFNFSSSSELYIGWANGTGFKPTGKGNTNITQGFTDTGGSTTITGDEFVNSFDLRIDVNQTTGEIAGRTMSLRQDVAMGDGQVNNTTDIQSFLVELREGSLLSASGQLVLDLADGTTDTVSWVNGDSVMVSWIGQAVNVADASASTPDISKFGFQGVTRVDQSATPVTKTISTFSNTQVDVELVDTNNPSAGYVTPYDWDSLFGTAPTLPSVPISIP